MKKLIAVMVVLILVVASFAGCASKQVNSGKGVKESNEDNIMKVYTSFYPMYFLASEIGGDRAEVINLTPAGAEPHDWEPSPKTIAEMQRGRMFIYNGVEMEGWAEDIIGTLNQNHTKVVCASDGVELLKPEEHEHHHEGEADGHSEDKEENEKEDHHNHGEYDPHVWVSPVRYKQQALNVLNAFIELDPVNKGIYEKNYKMLADKLDKLDKDIREGLKDRKSSVIITSHDAFSYFAHDYDLEQIPIRGISPDDEPSPAQMAELVEECREHSVKYIFVEKLVNPKLSETLAREAGAETLILNAAHGLSDSEIKQGKDYFTLMYDNMNNLIKALSE
ncbi:MAG: metal ABC transporter substrate-binding protein [Bacillota bacterium]